METRVDSVTQIDNVLDALPFLVWLSREDKSFEFVNAQWLEYTGHKAETLLGQGWLTSIHPDDVTQLAQTYNAAFAKHEPLRLTCRIQSSDSGYNWFRGEAAPRFSREGVFLGYAGAFIPLREEELNAPLESFVAGQSKEIKELNDKLADKKLAQERHNAELESFTYIASHDLQEPLRKIQSFSKMIMAKDSVNLSDSGKDYFSRIMMAAERMQRLIDDLLSYSATRVSDVSFENADLNKVMEEVKTNFLDVIEEKKALVDCGHLPTIPVIRFQVHQLFTNVLANALKFSRTDVPVVIKISATQVGADQIHSIEEVQPGKYWQISFSDNGIGFEQQYENRIFELFQRLHGKNEYVGTGIGLAICKKIVHNHHGHITATGRPGEGSVFNIYLPITETTPKV